MVNITLPNGLEVKKVDKISSNDLVKVKTNQQLQMEDARIRHRIDELPLQGNKMNTISVVLSYYLFGLSVNDIATMLKMTSDQVGRIMMLPAFSEMQNAVSKSIIENDTEDVRQYIQKQTKRAAEKVMEIMETSAPKYALAAAQDILDRGGHRPIDIVEHINKMDGELRIVHITKDEKANNSIQDVEFEEV